MQYYLFFILTILINASYGQNFCYPTIKTNGHSTNDFVPIGWTILDSTFGDLNKDGLNDAAVILQHKDSVILVNSMEDTVLTQPRILLVLFKNTDDNKFSLVEKSNSFILLHEDPIMDDPYQGITIEKGILRLDFHLFHNMGSYYSTISNYKYRYDGRQFKLIGADLFIFHRGTLDYEDYSYNFLTKKRIYTTGNEHKGIKKTKVKFFNWLSLKTFKTFIEPYSWEIEKDILL